jgi:hypothetical protein
LDSLLQVLGGRHEHRATRGVVKFAQQFQPIVQSDKVLIARPSRVLQPQDFANCGLADRGFAGASVLLDPLVDPPCSTSVTHPPATRL